MPQEPVQSRKKKRNGVPYGSRAVRWSFAWAVFFSIWSLSACSWPYPLSPSQSSSRPKIGFIVSTLQEERYQKDKKAFLETAKELGADAFFASCNNRELTQAAQVENMLARNISVLVIQAVNGDAASSFVKQALQDNVKVVAYDRLIPGVPISGYITEDSRQVGRLQAEAAVRATQGKGNYVILKGQAGHSVAEARTQGILEVLSRYPKIKVVAEQYHNAWSPQLAMQTVENALTQNKNQIDAIIANNSGMAHGAVQALEEQNLIGKVFVAGADADQTAIRNLLSGRQQFEVMISIPEMAKSAARVAFALARGEDFPFTSNVDNGYKTKIPTVNAPVFGVDPGNVRTRIIDSGFHPEESFRGYL